MGERESYERVGCKSRREAVLRGSTEEERRRNAIERTIFALL